MPDQPSPRRRFQFRLRTLMIGVTLLAVPMAYVGWQAKIVRERKAMLEDSHFCLVDIRTDGNNISWLRRTLGDVDCFAIIGDEQVTAAALDRYRATFPEADVWREGDRPAHVGMNSHFHKNRTMTEIHD